MVYEAGGARNVIVLQPMKAAMTFCDIDPGRWIDVPGCRFLHHSMGLSREPYPTIQFGFPLFDDYSFSGVIRIVF